jgi:hypothetical protein
MMVATRHDEDQEFVLPVALTSTELAMLEFTNGSASSNVFDQQLLLTSKESYLWAAFIALCAESKNVTREQFESAARGMLDEFSSVRSPGEFDPSYSEALYVLLIKSFAHRLQLDAEFSVIFRSVRDTYASLVKRGLIEDPFFLSPNLLQTLSSSSHMASVGIAVLGLIPTEFGRVTEEGRTISLKIRSLYLDYERTVKDGRISTQVNFRVLQLVKAFLDLTRNGLDALDRKNASPLHTKTTKGKKARRDSSKSKK